MSEPATQEQMGDAAAAAPSRPGALDWVLVAWMAVLGVVAGVVGFFFLPLWIGSFPLPVSVLVAVAATGLLPRVCHRLTGSMAAAVAPVTAWFVTTLVLYLVPNPTYARPLRVISADWRMLVLIGLGCLAGAASLGLLWGDHLRRKMAQR